jgi:pimeloyl-ACP methyl ester carboxylesterase
MTALVIAITVLVGGTILSPAAATPTASGSCATSAMPASLGAGAAQTLSLVTRLCEPARPTNTVEVLVSGSSLLLEYWDPMYQPERYSMVRPLTAAGFATFMYDRAGTGRSSKPPSPMLTIDTDAWNLHQIVQWLRQRYARVITGGISSGAVVAVREAATYADVSGVVIMGVLHNVNEVHLMQAGATMRPAMLDPRWRDAGLDPGYVTFADASWAFGANTDPGMLRWFDGIKDVITGTQQATLLPYLFATSPDETARVRVPVLVALGQRDFINCDAPGTDCRDATTVRAAESRFFNDDARLEVFVLPGAGHSINSAPNARDWFAAEVAWSRRVVGVDHPVA